MKVLCAKEAITYIRSPYVVTIKTEKLTGVFASLLVQEGTDIVHGGALEMAQQFERRISRAI